MESDNFNYSKTKRRCYHGYLPKDPQSPNMQKENVPRSNELLVYRIISPGPHSPWKQVKLGTQEHAKTDILAEKPKPPPAAREVKDNSIGRGFTPSYVTYSERAYWFFRNLRTVAVNVRGSNLSPCAAAPEKCSRVRILGGGRVCMQPIDETDCQRPDLSPAELVTKKHKVNKGDIKEDNSRVEIMLPTASSRSPMESGTEAGDGAAAQQPSRESCHSGESNHKKVNKGDANLTTEIICFEKETDERNLKKRRRSFWEGCYDILKRKECIFSHDLAGIGYKSQCSVCKIRSCERGIMPSKSYRRQKRIDLNHDTNFSNLLQDESNNYEALQNRTTNIYITEDIKKDSPQSDPAADPAAHNGRKIGERCAPCAIYMSKKKQISNEETLSNSSGTKKKQCKSKIYKSTSSGMSIYSQHNGSLQSGNTRKTEKISYNGKKKGKAASKKMKSIIATEILDDQKTNTGSQKSKDKTPLEITGGNPDHQKKNNQTCSKQNFKASSSKTSMAYEKLEFCFPSNIFTSKLEISDHKKPHNGIFAIQSVMTSSSETSVPQGTNEKEENKKLQKLAFEREILLDNKKDINTNTDLEQGSQRICCRKTELVQGCQRIYCSKTELEQGSQRICYRDEKSIQKFNEEISSDIKSNFDKHTTNKRTKSHTSFQSEGASICEICGQSLSECDCSILEFQEDIQYNRDAKLSTTELYHKKETNNFSDENQIKNKKSYWEWIYGVLLPKEKAKKSKKISRNQDQNFKNLLQDEINYREALQVRKTNIYVKDTKKEQVLAPESGPPAIRCGWKSTEISGPCNICSTKEKKIIEQIPTDTVDTDDQIIKICVVCGQPNCQCSCSIRKFQETKIEPPTRESHNQCWRIGTNYDQLKIEISVETVDDQKTYAESLTTLQFEQENICEVSDFECNCLMLESEESLEEKQDNTDAKFSTTKLHHKNELNNINENIMKNKESKKNTIIESKREIFDHKKTYNGIYSIRTVMPCCSKTSELKDTNKKEENKKPRELTFEREVLPDKNKHIDTITETESEQGSQKVCCKKKKNMEFQSEGENKCEVQCQSLCECGCLISELQEEIPVDIQYNRDAKLSTTELYHKKEPNNFCDENQIKNEKIKIKKSFWERFYEVLLPKEEAKRPQRIGRNQDKNFKNVLQDEINYREALQVRKTNIYVKDMKKEQVLVPESGPPIIRCGWKSGKISGPCNICSTKERKYDDSDILRKQSKEAATKNTKHSEGTSISKESPDFTDSENIRKSELEPDMKSEHKSKDAIVKTNVSSKKSFGTCCSVNKNCSPVLKPVKSLQYSILSIDFSQGIDSGTEPKQMDYKKRWQKQASQINKENDTIFEHEKSKEFLKSLMKSVGPESSYFVHKLFKSEKCQETQNKNEKIAMRQEKETLTIGDKNEGLTTTCKSSIKRSSSEKTQKISNEKHKTSIIGLKKSLELPISIMYKRVQVNDRFEPLSDCNKSAQIDNKIIRKFYGRFCNKSAEISPTKYNKQTLTSRKSKPQTDKQSRTNKSIRKNYRLSDKSAEISPTKNNKQTLTSRKSEPQTQKQVKTMGNHIQICKILSNKDTITSKTLCYNKKKTCENRVYTQTDNRSFKNKFTNVCCIKPISSEQKYYSLREKDISLSAI